ncbi:MAG: hypothetical protein AAFZ38_11555 [Myxococcota bacterium]
MGRETAVLMVRRVCVALAVSAAVGCSSRQTQVIVDIDADIETSSRASWVQVEVFNTEGDNVLMEVLPASSFPIRVPLTPRDDDPARTFALTARLFNTAEEPSADATPVAEVSAQSSYVSGEVNYIALRFASGCLEGQQCAEGQTCFRGECRAACFSPVAQDDIEELEPVCGRCERCVDAECVTLSEDVECGCPGDRCLGGQCVSSSIAALSAGLRSTCAIQGDQLYCWGHGGEKELGLGSQSDVQTPTLVRSGVALVATNGGLEGSNTAHACAVDLDGTVTCWGQNRSGQLGVLPTSEELEAVARPRAVEPFSDEPIVKIVVGGNHSCALVEGGALWCWGGNFNRQLGQGDTDEDSLPVQVPPPTDAGWSDVVAGRQHSCGISAARVYCWGLNSVLQIGVERSGAVPSESEKVSSPTPIMIDPELEFVQVSSGAFHSCGLTSEGAVYCWGGNRFGNLGRETDQDDALPGLVNGGARFVSISSGRSHNCGLGENGTLQCWGRNGPTESGNPAGEGQLGTGDNVNRLRPTPTAGPPNGWTQIALGEQHSCAVRNDAFLWCWGWNANGRLGLGDNNRRFVPTAVCFPE